MWRVRRTRERVARAETGAMTVSLEDERMQFGVMNAEEENGRVGDGRRRALQHNADDGLCNAANRQRKPMVRMVLLR